MSYRRHAAKPSVALWTLAAALLILGSVGMFALIALVSVAAVAAAVGLLVFRRSGSVGEAVPVTPSGQHRVSA